VNVVPTEQQEQIALVQYLTIRGIPHFRVPNETYTKSWNQKRLNKALGVKSGVPDLFVIYKNRMKAVELKRKKGGVTSDAQKEWIGILNEAGIPAKVCKGSDEAIAFIEGDGDD